MKQNHNNFILILLGIGLMGLITSSYIHIHLDEHSCIEGHEELHADCANAHLLDPSDLNHLPSYVALAIIAVGFYLIYKDRK